VIGAPHLALVGPTASGKSALALAVARALGDVEIVSIDSMQIYRGLDIGTAKASVADRAAVAHHLVDVASPAEDWSVARFQQAARDAIAEIAARGKRALLVGGTGLYVRAVIDPLRFPPDAPDGRAELMRATATDQGLAAAYDELARRDPSAAAGIDPGNRRRIVRALEVIEATGRPFSSFGRGLREYGPSVFPLRMAGVWLSRAVVAERIERRVGAMRDAGLLDEVRALTAQGPLSRTATQAIGYKELVAHLDGMEPSLDAAFAGVVSRTRAFARRQRMWFRRDPRITWFAAADNPDRVLPALLASWEA
jgi:tRNA dimethylallyltransferase